MTLIRRSIPNALSRFAATKSNFRDLRTQSNIMRCWASTTAGEHLSPVWGHLTNIQPVRGEGIYLWDAEGTKYTDFTSGIGVTNLGHTHPNITKAIVDQAHKMHFGQMNVVMTPQFVELSERLNEITPNGIESFFFANSGAEATEAAVKLARHASGKTNIVVFSGSFHGRTAQCMAMTTSKYIYRENYAPLPGGIHVTPFPHAYQFGWDEATTVDFCMKELERLVLAQTSPEETAAIFVEPILGEGGYVPMPISFLKQLRGFCDAHNILLVVDEIQSGFGRSGKLFAIEYSDVQPDILVMAKGLGNGMPISAVGASHHIMSKWKKGTHGGTYGGGNTIVARAALATIDTMLDEKIPQQAANMGDYLMTKLRDVQDRYPVIGDVRGLGLMVGTEFTMDGKPCKSMALRVQSLCLEHNLLLLNCGTYENVIRWIPPLVVTQEQIDTAVDIFEHAVREATAELSEEEIA